MGKLFIVVVRAENLINVNNSHVICYQGNKHQQTKPARGPSPDYGNQLLVFDVDDDTTPLILQVFDIDNVEPLLETNVTFEDLKAELVPKEEFWINNHEGDPSSAKLRLKITYEQNEVLKWDAEVDMLTSDIKNDASILTQVRYFIDQLRTPFGFLVREYTLASAR